MQLEALHWNVDPVIVQIGHFPLKYYGILFTTGVALGYVIVRKAYLKAGKTLESLDSLATHVLIGIVAGARLGHCLFYEPAYFLTHPVEMFLPIQKIAGSYQFTGYLGLASHGGSIGVLLAIWWYAKKNKINIWWLLDRMAVAAPLTAIFIRLGNFMNSEIIGEPTNSHFGVVFERVDQVVRHPAQLYEAAAYLLIFLLLQRLDRSEQNRPQGLLFGWLLLLVFSARFCIEFFKINQVQFEANLPLNMGQLLSVPFIAIGAAIICFSQYFPRT